MCFEARREKDSLVFSLEEKEREEPLFSVGMMIHRILSESSKSGNDTRGPCVSHDRRTTMQKNRRVEEKRNWSLWEGEAVCFERDLLQTIQTIIVNILSSLEAQTSCDSRIFWLSYCDSLFVYVCGLRAAGASFMRVWTREYETHWNTCIVDKSCKKLERKRVQK